MECAEGAHVTLLNASGAELEHCLTDNYGDFKFDKLEEGSGTYAIRVELKGRETKNIEFRLTTSLNLGTIFV